MDNLTKRVRYYVDIDPKHFRDLGNLPSTTRHYSIGEDIISRGDPVKYVFVVEQGWAIRYRMLDDGRRQILNFMLPGDSFDVLAITQAETDHSVAAASNVTVRQLRAEDFVDTVRKNSELATAFWWGILQEEAILREQIVRIGRRSARERVAHLLLELNRRVAAIEGRVSDMLDLPFPQALLADALGLSVVHISRTLTWLRNNMMIETGPDGIRIIDRSAMITLSGFDTRYLHLGKLRVGE